MTTRGLDGVDLHGFWGGSPSLSRQGSGVRRRHRVVLAKREGERLLQGLWLGVREAIARHSSSHTEDEDMDLRRHVNRTRDDARSQVSRLLNLVAHRYLPLFENEQFCSHARLVLWRLESKSEITLETLQSRERVLVNDELAEGPFFGLPRQSGQQEVDLRCWRFDQRRSDRDVNLAQPTIQWQSVLTDARVR